MESQQPEHLISLPLVNKNEESASLPLVINVVAKYWGEDIHLPEGGESAGLRGTSMIDGIELVERLGLTCYIYKGTLRDLKKRIDQGIPPIVILPGIYDTLQHAMIVSGYNIEERRILMYVPEPETIGAIPEEKFKDDWQQDDMNTILIVPSDMKELFRNEDLKFKESNRMCLEAERLRQKGKMEEAIEKLQKAAKVDPDNAQTWCILAGIYNEVGSDEAKKYYEKAIALNPRYYLAYRGLGNYYLKKKDYSLAESHYTKAISINPIRFGPIYKNRAVVRMQLGNNNQGAKEDLQEYLNRVPTATDRQNIQEAIMQL